MWNVTEHRGAGDMYSLRVVHADCCERLQRIFVLDTFRDSLNAHDASDPLDRFDNGAVHGVRDDVANEGAVDLQEVDGQRLEIRERGHAAAEVIERNG